MGISSIMGALLKNVSWGRIADMAMEYAPGLYRKAMERFQNEGEPAAAPTADKELLERVARLEKLLLEQEGVIRDQVTKNNLLTEKCTALEGRLLIFKVGSGLLLLALLATTVLLLK